MRAEPSLWAEDGEPQSETGLVARGQPEPGMQPPGRDLPG